MHHRRQNAPLLQTGAGYKLAASGDDFFSRATVRAAELAHFRAMAAATAAALGPGPQKASAPESRGPAGRGRGAITPAWAARETSAPDKRTRS